MPEHHDEHHPGASFTELVSLMNTLRSPGGCSWTTAQTHESIMHYLVEETYEVVEAVESPDGVNLPLLREELGDVLLNVIFHARMASEIPTDQGGFDIDDVVQGLSQKLIRRNPHVFGSAQDTASTMSAQEIYDAWDELKKSEKPERTGVFDGVPPHLPALAFTDKALSKAAAAEIEAELPPHEDAESAWAATVFALVQDARAQGIDPEKALRNYTKEMMRRSEQSRGSE